MDFYAKLLPYKSRLWVLLHHAFKPVIRKTIDFIYNRYYKEIYAKKMNEGWINQELALLHDELEELFEKEYRHDKTKRNPDGTWNLKHKDMRMFYNIRAIALCLLDEDTFYIMRWFYLMECMHRDWDKYQERLYKTHAYWDWNEIMAHLKENDTAWLKAYAENKKQELSENGETKIQYENGNMENH